MRTRSAIYNPRRLHRIKTNPTVALLQSHKSFPSTISSRLLRYLDHFVNDHYCEDITLSPSSTNFSTQIGVRERQLNKAEGTLSVEEQRLTYAPSAMAKYNQIHKFHVEFTSAAKGMAGGKIKSQESSLLNSPADIRPQGHPRSSSKTSEIGEVITTRLSVIFEEDTYYGS